MPDNPGGNISIRAAVLTNLSGQPANSFTVVTIEDDYRFARSQVPVLYSPAMHSGAFSQVAHALKVMQSDYSAKLDVEQLAGTEHMNPSAFHRAFKEITSDSLMHSI